MKRNIFLLVFTLIIAQNLCSQEKSIKYNGIKYLINIEKGTASVGKNYRDRLFTRYDWVGTLKGDILIDSIIIYKKRSYPVTSIIGNSFLGSSKIKTLTLPSTIINLNKYSLSSFYNFKAIYVEGNNPALISKDGILFNRAMTKILCYPGKHVGSFYEIPKSVISIENDAFRFCRNLDSISIPNSVKFIKEEAFRSCDFKNIKLPDELVEIGEEAFYFCSNLESITIPENVTKIGKNAFEYCSSLENVVFYNKNLVFPEGCFKGCDKLKKENIKHIVPVSSYLELAKQGNPEFQYKLAKCYLNGEGYVKDTIKAVEWLNKASDQDYALSQKQLGDIYIDKNTSLYNAETSLYYFKLAAKNGNLDAHALIGDFYYLGKVVEKDLNKAHDYYLHAAEGGNAHAQKMLGYFYYEGLIDSNANYTEAFKWFKLGAENGDIYAANILGYCYYSGEGTEPSNKNAVIWFEKALNGGLQKYKELYCDLSFDQATEDMNNRYYYSAIKKYSSVLNYESQNIDAYINRGYCYLNLESKDYKKAESDFKKALTFDATNATAKNNLQFIEDYYKRINEAKEFSTLGDNAYKNRNYQKAADYYFKSIALDNTNSYVYYSIGYCFYSCDQYEDAIKYFDKAISINPNYSDAIKAKKSARSILIANAISQAANSVANSINTINTNAISANTVSSQSNNSTTSIKASSNCSSYQQKYNTQKQRAYDDIIRFAKLKGNDKAYSVVGEDYATTPNAALNITTLKSIRATQNLMKTYRTQAQSNGCYISKAEEESWNP